MWQFAPIIACIFKYVGIIFQGIIVVQSVVEVVSTVVSSAYDFMVDSGMVERKKDVKGYIDTVKSAGKLLAILKKNLTMMKEANKDQTQKVEAALGSLKYLDFTLKQLAHCSDLDFQQKTHQVQKVEGIYSDLKKALDCIKERPAKSWAWSIKQIFQKYVWIMTPHTKRQLQEIEDKIKNAVQKSMELMTISAFIATNRSQVLQQFNTYRMWFVTSDTLDPPSPP